MRTRINPGLDLIHSLVHPSHPIRSLNEEKVHQIATTLLSERVFDSRSGPQNLGKALRHCEWETPVQDDKKTPFKVLQPILGLHVSTFDHDISSAKKASTLLRSLRFLKRIGAEEAVNGALACGHGISPKHFRQIAESIGVDLRGFLLLSHEDCLLAILRQEEESEAVEQRVVTKESCLPYCMNASQAVLASLINGLKLDLAYLVHSGVDTDRIERALPLLRYCDLAGLDEDRQLAWHSKTLFEVVEYLRYECTSLRLPEGLEPIKRLDI
ncbi:MAG: hypothetical protein KDK78_09695 [Chlamydiia bacterium]|nr:hypothetical protein [Chlamydiia bacterium]